MHRMSSVGLRTYWWLFWSIKTISHLVGLLDRVWFQTLEFQTSHFVRICMIIFWMEQPTRELAVGK